MQIKIRAKLNGFSLVELLIVLGLVGIMAKIAYPSYLEHTQKAKRAQCEAGLISLANALEMYKMQNGGKYTTGTAPTAAGLLSDQVPVNGGTKICTLAIDSIDATSYTLKATPVQTDAKCGYVTYTQASVQGVEKGTVAECW